MEAGIVLGILLAKSSSQNVGLLLNLLGLAIPEASNNGCKSERLPRLVTS